MGICVAYFVGMHTIAILGRHCNHPPTAEHEPEKRKLAVLTVEIFANQIMIEENVCMHGRRGASSFQTHSHRHTHEWI